MVKQLIQLAPFTDEIKQQLLEKVDSFSPEKKIEVEKACWELISIKYQSDLQFTMQKAALEMAKGGKKVSREDFQKMGDDLFNTLVQKLEAQGSQEQIEEIRKRLATQSA